MQARATIEPIVQQVMNMQAGNHPLEFADRLVEALKKNGQARHGAGSALAKLCAVTTKAANKWLNGEAMPKHDNIVTIANHYNVRAEWLEYGVEPMSTTPKENHTQLDTADSNQPKEGSGNVITADFQKARLRDGEITIPQFDVRGAMGPGQVAPDYVETIRHLTLHQDYLSALGVRYTQASNLAVVTGYGQSMEGTINDGDPVIIDRGVQTFMGDGVYLLTWNDMLYIKRLQMVSATEIELISDNPKHKDRVVKLDEVTVHAKVLIAWNARKL